MNVNKVLTKDYVNKPSWKVRKNKANSKPIKANLPDAQMNVSNFITADYENKTLSRRGKNKPNTNPIQTQSNPIKANKMPKQTQYKPNTNPIKPNFKRRILLPVGNAQKKLVVDKCIKIKDNLTIGSKIEIIG